LEELGQLPDEPEYVAAIRKSGGGRKRYDEQHPKIDEQFLNVLKEHTAGDPMDEKVVWTDLMPEEISKLLERECYQETAPKTQLSSQKSAKEADDENRGASG
jgi:hypothetical protein